MGAKYESYLVSDVDELELSVLAVVPQKKPYRAVVQLVHGMSEHKERYLPFMEYLAEQGYVSVIHDHRGHGKSIRGKADLGYMYGGGAEAVVRDIGLVNRKIRAELSGLPLILMGHSMGSLAVRAFAAEHDSCMDMLIVCGSPSYNGAMPLGKAIASVEKAVLGERHRSCLIESISFGPNVWKFRKDKTCTAWICSDPAVAREYETSRLCGFTFTDDAYLALFDLMKRAYDTKHFCCTNPDMPVLFVSGAEDPCLIDVRHFAKAVQAMRSAGYFDVKGKLYPGMRHEILNEKDKYKVYKDIVTYMRRKGF
ncbi:MAG: alpha/beta fold hydrolase [Eubacteriales bacterium]|nr:alpha/beta fold hydrolase [Eubacteriales bacterium]